MTGRDGTGGRGRRGRSRGELPMAHSALTAGGYRDGSGGCADGRVQPQGRQAVAARRRVGEVASPEASVSELCGGCDRPPVTAADRQSPKEEVPIKRVGVPDEMPRPGRRFRLHGVEPCCLPDARRGRMASTPVRNRPSRPRRFLLSSGQLQSFEISHEAWGSLFDRPQILPAIHPPLIAQDRSAVTSHLNAIHHHGDGVAADRRR